jgi:Flp pilus assembly protein TadD
MARGNILKAESFIHKAYAILGADIPVLANKAELLFQKGRADEALEALNSSDSNDPDGILANERGNILVRSNRLEEADKEYQEALKKNPKELSFLYNRASCLIELGMFGEADYLISKGLEIEQSVRLLELIAFLAAKKGELARAEAAYAAALSMEPDNPSILYSLGLVYLTMNRWASAEATLLRLDSVSKKDNHSISKARELKLLLENATTREIACALCDISWKVHKNTEKTPEFRLVDQPPDHFPAGTCPGCKKTYCIGCGKHTIDASNRFICPACKIPLKFLDEGLKKIVYHWSLQSKNR